MKRKCGEQKGGNAVHGAILAIWLALPSPALANPVENARDAMEAGEFDTAMALLEGPARSGNADAEELIGILYALGLGVERDDRRAFEWYLRSAMKGHPGAQSGVGWYYEIGRGLPAPDLVRAYMWYTLSAIGGDPDAAISLEEVVKKMDRAQIDASLALVADYKAWMYPFR
ncbi:sel1 repeat family protein [Maribius pontilimi]|uniref:Sel1 repeat family protein n=1 Tax=Palleronia pontilimi TaxID=1964209 RepID=A0A934MDG1_9RHOB|nr:tetratricopeptide repeat protein [Palleronia pontilimi]MBJ3763455.1 sel1 repeat family protein [Palleronia pontilimi]